jgi:hypothetical protein
MASIACRSSCSKAPWQTDGVGIQARQHDERRHSATSHGGLLPNDSCALAQEFDINQ